VAVAAAERLFPRYRNQIEHGETGDVELLRGALDYVWETLVQEAKADAKRVDLLVTRLTSMMPMDTDWTSSSQYLASALAARSYAVISIADRDPRSAGWALEWVTSAIDAYVVERDHLDETTHSAATTVWTDTLMREEHQRRAADLALVSGGSAGRYRELRARSQMESALPLSGPGDIPAP
jgi:uncharacterized protein YjaG (DUF416 family)